MLEGTDQMVHGLPHWGASVILRRPVSREFGVRSEEHTSELQSQSNIVCRLLLEKKNILRALVWCRSWQYSFHIGALHAATSYISDSPYLDSSVTHSPPVKYLADYIALCFQYARR